MWFFTHSTVVPCLTETALHFATVPVSVQGCLQAYMLHFLLPPPTEAKGVYKKMNPVISHCAEQSSYFVVIQSEVNSEACWTCHCWPYNTENVSPEMQLRIPAA